MQYDYKHLFPNMVIYRKRCFALFDIVFTFFLWFSEWKAGLLKRIASEEGLCAFCGVGNEFYMKILLNQASLKQYDLILQKKFPCSQISVYVNLSNVV